MPQETIGQRLKFLMETLNLKVRTFASALDVSETNVRNYISRDSKPSSEILERIVRQYPNVNTLWLLTGNGEPFIAPTNESNQTITGAQKFFRSPVVNTNHGPAYQENNTAAQADFEAIKNKLALVEQEVEHLKAQLATKDTLIAAKDETITLLRASFTRPT